MILKRHGFPVWFADPYGNAEIEIGDIGYMRSATSSSDLPSVSLTVPLFREGSFVLVKHYNYNFTPFHTHLIPFPGPIYSQTLKRQEGGVEVGL